MKKIYISILFSLSSYIATGFSVQVTNQQWYTLRVQCDGEKTSRKLKPFKHLKCPKGMDVWYGKKPLKSFHENLGRLCGKTSTSINLHKHYFHVTSGFCRNTHIHVLDYGWKFVIQGGAYGASIRRT